MNTKDKIDLPHHELNVSRVCAVLENTGYIRVFEESYGEGERVLYRKGASDIFIENVFNSK
jgi:hypothetical protein